jgi:hypothetical protein
MMAEDGRMEQVARSAIGYFILHPSSLILPKAQVPNPAESLPQPQAAVSGRKR